MITAFLRIVFRSQSEKTGCLLGAQMKAEYRAITAGKAAFDGTSPFFCCSFSRSQRENEQR
jgi:hypothetical protein